MPTKRVERFWRFDRFVDRLRSVSESRVVERRFPAIFNPGSVKAIICARTSSLLNAQVWRFEESWFEDIQFLAARHGLTFEETFVKLALGESFSSESDESVE